VRLQPGAPLPLVGHSGADDIYVLEGSLGEQGEGFPAGTYLGLASGERPPLRAVGEALVFVKSRPNVRQRRVVVTTRSARWESSHSPGLWMMHLDEGHRGRVVLLRFEPGTALGLHQHEGGEEFLVLRGALSDGEGTYRRLWWVRQPPQSAHAVASPAGCVLLTIAGHLA
jgi:anti-sigma factor ChrR (cupin superfamily)